MVPAAVVDGEIAKPRNSFGRRHHHRWRQLQLSRRHPSRGADCAPPDPLRRRGNQRRPHGGAVGYCLMIGGEKSTVDSLEPVFVALAHQSEVAMSGAEVTGAERGFLYCGGMAPDIREDGPQRHRVRCHGAFAEGFNILRNADTASANARRTPKHAAAASGVLSIRFRFAADRRTLASPAASPLLAAGPHAPASRKTRTSTVSPATFRIPARPLAVDTPSKRECPHCDHTACSAGSVRAATRSLPTPALGDAQAVWWARRENRKKSTRHRGSAYFCRSVPTRAVRVPHLQADVRRVVDVADISVSANETRCAPRPMMNPPLSWILVPAVLPNRFARAGKRCGYVS